MHSAEPYHAIYSNHPSSTLPQVIILIPQDVDIFVCPNDIYFIDTFDLRIVKFKYFEIGVIIIWDAQ